MTTRAAAEAFFIAGTNRAMFRFTMMNHLCRDMEQVHDTSRVPDRIRQDVSRSPGGDSRIFLNDCIGCHTGMDPLAQAFAYYNFDTTPGPHPVHARASCRPSTSTTTTTSRTATSRRTTTGTTTGGAGQNALLGWDTALPGSGTGAKSMGQELANSDAFARARSRRCSGTCACGRRCDAADRAQIDSMVSSFRSGGYRLKQVSPSPLCTAWAIERRNLTSENIDFRRSQRSLLVASLRRAGARLPAAAVRDGTRTPARPSPPTGPPTPAGAANGRHPELPVNASGTTSNGEQPLRRLPRRHARRRSSRATTTSTSPGPAADQLVNRTDPGSSRIVQKMGGGHNCWLANQAHQACGDIMQTWIENWAGTASGGTQDDPARRAARQGRGPEPNFPADSARLSRPRCTRWLTEYCAGCHSSTSATQQSPFFADDDVDTAYAAAKTKINLDNPAHSRLVLRLRDEFHNCWDNCARQRRRRWKTRSRAFANGRFR